MPVKTLDITELGAIANCLLVSADKFAESARLFTEFADHGGTGPIDKGTCQTMAEKFTRQEREARAFYTVFMDCEGAALDIIEPEEDEEQG